MAIYKTRLIVEVELSAFSEAIAKRKFTDFVRNSRTQGIVITPKVAPEFYKENHLENAIEFNGHKFYQETLSQQDQSPQEENID